MGSPDPVQPPASRPRRLRSALAEFLSTEAAGGAVLLAAAVVALVWANSPWSDSYHDLWESNLTIGPIDESLRHWLNDGLMAVFFFVVGLEIKRELVKGELRDRRVAALPVLGAVGGMVAPALVFLAFNAGGAAERGWAIPMATDIAFVLGVLAVLGDRVPSSLKLFLLTLAIADDIGAIAVIAFFYSDGLAPGWLAGAAMVVLVILMLQRLNVGRPIAYALPALALWYFVFESGVHATIAGVVLGLLTPTDGRRPIIERLEHRFHPWSSFAVIPLFALANAGITIDGAAFSTAFGDGVGWGVAAGLLVGKTLGISAAVAVAVRARVTRLPADVRRPHLVGAAALGGIGFTVSLFVAELAFAGTDLLAPAKLAVLVASAASGLLGAAIIAVTTRRNTRQAAVD